MNGNNICHALHIGDCSDAYVAVAPHEQRAEVDGQVFNISALRYETVDEIARALTKEYNIGGMDYVSRHEKVDWPPMLIDCPQRTRSQKKIDGMER